MASSIFAAEDPNVSVATTITSPEPAANIAQLENGNKSEEQWKPGKREWLVMITLAISSLTVALDATILVPVLPVSKLNTFCQSY